jgi:hypothetical protein
LVITKTGGAFDTPYPGILNIVKCVRQTNKTIALPKMEIASYLRNNVAEDLTNIQLYEK